MQKIIIDTDTASDDAVALIMAFRFPGIQIEAVTVVAGNVNVDQAVQNALFIAEMCNIKVPIYRGLGAPLFGKLSTAVHIHGEDGMGDIGLKLTGRQPTDGHAVDKLVELVCGQPGEITLVALGPLTNIAMAILKEPSFAGCVKECFIMGGTSDGFGNVSPVAEFNVWVDPEAAKCVFESGMPITMIGWDISRKYATFHAEDAKILNDLGTPLAQLSVDIQRVLNRFSFEKTGISSFDLPDPIAMAIALDSSIGTKCKSCFVGVETGGIWSRGQTVIDDRNLFDKPCNATVVVEASRERFLELLYRSLI